MIKTFGVTSNVANVVTPVLIQMANEYADRKVKTVDNEVLMMLDFDDIDSSELEYLLAETDVPSSIVNGIEGAIITRRGTNVVSVDIFMDHGIMYSRWYELIAN